MSGGVGVQVVPCAAAPVAAATKSSAISSACVIDPMVRLRKAERKRMLESATMRVWRVFATYVAAVASIFATSGIAIVALKAMFPDATDQALVQSLPGLIAGSLASSVALIVTMLLVVQPTTPAALRLLPGWESGRVLIVMILAMLALGQLLDSLTWLIGWAQHGSMVLVRRVLETAVGPDLFGAVIVFGLIAGAAEEIFFRGFMLTRLAEHWGSRRAIVASAACFGVLHIDPNGIHMALAFVMGLYLGFVAEHTGSTLPAIICHVVNNAVYTLQISLGVTLEGRAGNAALAIACVVVFVACLAWLKRVAPPPAAA